MRIGILGGGQLGMYLSEAAHKQGKQVAVLDPNMNASTMLKANQKIVSKYDDQQGLYALAQYSDLIAYEFENVSPKSIDYLVSLNANIPQGKKPLEIASHRVKEKEFVRACGLRCVTYVAINTKEDVIKARDKLEYPFLIKTCQGGYDGKGQWMIKSDADIQSFIEKMKHIEYIGEQFLPFQMEISCIVFRNECNSVCFEVFENIHQNGILHISISHARLQEDIKEKAKELSKQFMERANFQGIMTIEFFMDKDGELFVNEIAPRPHNSGHLTMDAYDVSQYDLAIDSLTNQQLQQPILKQKVVMLNVLGQHMKYLRDKNFDNHTKLYLYHKEESLRNRKMGHICFIGDDIEELIVKAENFYKEK